VQIGGEFLQIISAGKSQLVLDVSARGVLRCVPITETKIIDV